MKKTNSMRKYNAIKVAGMLFLTVAILWCIFGIKANAAERANNDKAEYQKQEMQLRNEIRGCLEDMGYCNSGITMTKVLDEEENREYKVLIHHQDLDADNTDKVQMVYDVLSDIFITGENITVNYTIF